MTYDPMRDLNPHAEARLAMVIYGYEYGSQSLGSMGFYDQLSDDKKGMLAMAVDDVLRTPTRAKQLPKIRPGVIMKRTRT